MSKKVETVVLVVDENNKIVKEPHRLIEIQARDPHVNGDEVWWTCGSHDFEVVDISPACSMTGCLHPTSPFADSKGDLVKKFAGKALHKPGIKPTKSGPPLLAASGHAYKVTYRVLDSQGNVVDTWDPHIYVGPP